MRDVSNWVFVSHGEKSTLEKEELLSPEETEYIIKYPREFDGDRVNWEDITEVIAAKLAEILEFNTVKAEVAYRNGKRGCLMLHFLTQYGADQGEPGGPLLASEYQNEYSLLQISDSKKTDLIEQSFSLIEKFSYFNIIKEQFLQMIIFDILIGNQDRHPLNWQVLYSGNESFFGPLYDNGASLGWQLDDIRLKDLLNDEVKMNRYYKRTKVKCGVLEHVEAPLLATQVLSYCTKRYPDIMEKLSRQLEEFDTDAYNEYISRFPLITDIRKEFLKSFIYFRKNKIISAIQKGM